MFKEKLHPVLDVRENIKMIDEDKAEVPSDFYALVFIDKINCSWGTWVGRWWQVVR